LIWLLKKKSFQGESKDVKVFKEKDFVAKRKMLDFDHEGN